VNTNQPPDQRPAIATVIALDRRPDPGEVLDREQRHRDDLEHVEPVVPDGVDPGLGLEHDRDHVGGDQRDKDAGDQRRRRIVGLGVVEDFVSSLAQFRHVRFLAS